MNRIRFTVFYYLRVLIVILAYWYANTLTTYAQGIKSTFEHPIYQDPDIFVITNRQIDTSNVQFSFTNNVNKGASLTFYRVNASSIDSLQLTPLDSTAFVAEIMDIKNQDWVLFIHGDGKPFEQAAIRGLNIQNTHKVRVIVFSWPSKDAHLSGLKNFNNSHQNVEKSLNHFNSVLNTMVGLRNSKTDFLNGHTLSLFLHSLGNYYLDCMGNKKMFLEKQPLLFDNVIINAAAVEEKNHINWVEKIHFQNNIFINSNKRDFNLKGLRIFTKHGKQLGEKVISPYANNAVYFNFTKSVGFRFPTGTTHTYFIGKVPEKNKNIRLFYYEILHGLKPDLDDKTRFKIRPKSFGDIIVRQ